MTAYTDSRFSSKAATFLRLGLALAGIYWLFSLFLHYRMSLDGSLSCIIYKKGTLPGWPQFLANFSGQRADGSQPKVGKVTMVYGNRSIYDRAVNTHIVHSQRLGYPDFILRSPILEGVWSKPAILLSVLLKELEKPPERRLEWLL